MATPNPSSTGGTASATNAFHYNERGDRERWPVLVYRLSSHRGWEVYWDPDMEEGVSSSNDGGGGRTTGKKASSNDQGNSKVSSTQVNTNRDEKRNGLGKQMVEELTAAPRTGCIEVRKMRLRIRLFQQHAPWDPKHQNLHRRQNQGSESHHQGHQGDRNVGGATATSAEYVGDGAAATDRAANNGASVDEYDPDVCESDGWNNNALVVRRKNTLMVSTRRGLGAVVFQFKSTIDCTEFCDRLVLLNREFFYQALPATEPRSEADAGAGGQKKRRRNVDEEGIVDGMDRRERYLTEMREQKRSRWANMKDQEQVNAHAIATRKQNRHDDNHRYSQDRSCQLGEVERDNVASDTTALCRQQRRKDELLSYIVRLAHNQDFRGFVDELERGLESAPDCSGVLAAMSH